MKKKKIFLGLGLVATALAVSSCAKKVDNITTSKTEPGKETEEDNTSTSESKLQVYKITWKNGLTNHKIDELEEGSKIVAPTQIPVKESSDSTNYIFDGWYTEETGGKKVTDFGNANGDITYYARFIEVNNQYTYTFYSENGVSEIKKETVDYGTEISVPEAPVKQATPEFSYEFDGWYTLPEGGEKVETFGTISSDVSYYAQYKEIKNKYYYKFVDDKLNVLVEETAEYGSSFNVPAAPVKASTQEYSYEFDGWYTAQTGGAKIEDFSNVTLTREIIFYAQYKETRNKYTYSFYDEAGNLIDTTTADYGTNIDVPTTPTKEATAEYTYTFDGWYTEETGGEKVTDFGLLEDNVSYYARFIPTKNQYTYSFYDDEGVLIYTTTDDYGTNIVVPADPTKESTQEYTYIFDGWYTLPEGGQKVETFTISSNVSYYARFIKNDRLYKATFLNYDGNIFASEEIEYGKPISAPILIPTKNLDDGNTYVFVGWYTEETAGEKVTEFGNISSDVVYYARFIIEESPVNRYTYTFYDELGNVIKTDYIAEGEEIVAPKSLPEKAKTQEYTYTFDGWYTLPEGGEKLETFGTISSNVSYYARFNATKNKYTYTFYDDKGNIVEQEEKEYGSTISAPTITKEKTQAYTYEFDGWYTEETGGEKVTDFGLLEDNVSYYARFNEVINKYTYTFYDEDGSIVLQKTLSYGTAILSPGTNPTKEADADYTYEFDGWYTLPEGGEKVVDFNALYKDVSYYAHYTAIAKLVVSFEVNQGTQTFDNIKVESGYSIQLPNAQDIDGFVFEGWFLDNKYTTKYTSQAITDNTVIYGYYAELFTVTLVVDNQTFDTITVKENSKLSISNLPTKEGYYLAGWALDEELFDLNTPITSNITLVAVFEEVKETEMVGYGSGLTPFTTISQSFTGKDDKSRPQLTEDLIVGNFTFKTKSVLDSENTVLNTQTSSIDVVLPTRGSILFTGSWGSKDAGKVYIYKVVDNNETLIYQSSSISNKGSVSVKMDSLSLEAGTYRIIGLKDIDSKGASIVVTKIAYEKVVEYVNVSYELNNGETIAPTSVKKGTIISELPQISYSGYRFIGWYTDEAFVAGSEFNANNPIESNIKLYAKWEEIAQDELATVSFNVNVPGKTIESIQVEKGTSLVSLPKLEIEGYRLNKWFSDSNYKNEFNLSTIISDDTTLYAEYIKIYSVEFQDVNGNTIIKLTKDDDSLITEKISKPYVEGYKFDHWINVETNQEFDITLDHVLSNLVLKAVYVIDEEPVQPLNITSAEGNQESATVKFDKYINSSDEYAQGYNVYLTGTVFNETKLTDKNVYITTEGNVVTAELFGLKVGSYTVSVVPVYDGFEVTPAKSSASFAVTAYDRSGYAHFKNTEGVGAYNDDGTVKENAIVLYVTDENKNTVELTYGGKTVKGIGNILNSVGQACGEAGHETECKKVDKSNVYYNKGNTNQGILLDLSENNIPLIVRFVGCVSNSGLYKQGTFDASKDGLIEGLTAYGKKGQYSGNLTPCGGTGGDNGHMARMKSATNVTFEGVGNDAIIDGWGFHLICETAHPEYGKNFEVRNLTFMNTPEDAVGMEGQADENPPKFKAPVERCWVHHNTFLCPNIANPTETDKAQGDGSCDFKRGNYFTCSYNYFEDCHKTNLVGSGSKSIQYNISFHHNIWYNCGSRMPKARQANIHFYNNYIVGTASDGSGAGTADLSANAYMYAENNYYLGAKNPVMCDAEGFNVGAAKLYGNVFVGAYGDISGIVDSREQQVTSYCGVGIVDTDYRNFDTNSELFYYDSSNKKSDCYLTDANTARLDCIAQAGSRYRTVLDLTKQKIDPSITNIASSASVSGDTTLDISKAKTILKVFTVTSPVEVTMAATGAGGFNTGYLVKKDGSLVLALTSEAQKAVLMPGEYVVISCVAFTTENGKNDKETTITTCVFKPFDSEELNQQLIDAYNEAHDAIPATIEYNDTNYNLIKAAITAYNNLGDLKSRITNYSDVTDAYNTYKSLGEGVVVDAINQIVLPVTTSNSSYVIQARKAYNALIAKISDANISNYQTLVDAESQMNELAADIFVNAANQIPTEITYTASCEELIENAEAAYKTLSIEQKNLSNVKSAYAKVTLARETFDNLEAANTVETQMKSANTITEFDAAYEAYNGLSADQKLVVDASVKSSFMIDYALVAINEIPATITRADGGVITKARTIFDLLTSTEQTSVINYDKLLAAEEAYAELGIETLTTYSTTDFTSWTLTGTTSSTATGVSANLSTDNTVVLTSNFMMSSITSVTLTVKVTDKGSTPFSVFTSTDGETWTQLFSSNAGTNNAEVALKSPENTNVSGPVYVRVKMACTKPASNPKAASLLGISINK